MTAPQPTAPLVRTLPLSARYIAKLTDVMRAAAFAKMAAEEAQEILNQRRAEAQRALAAQAAVMELVYELVGAPETAQVDLQNGTLRWEEAPAPAEPAQAEPAPVQHAGVEAHE